MAETINNVTARAFSDMVHHTQQQTQPRMRDWVEVRKFGKAEDYAYDSLGQVDARELDARYNRVQWTNIEWSRRKIGKRRFAVELPIDMQDVDNMLLNPQGEYVRACVNAINRRFDRTVIEAAFADISTGKQFATNVTFAAEGGLTVDATGGLTLPKILEGGRNFKNNEVGTETKVPLAIVYGGDEEATLLQIAQLTSRDYTSQFGLENGQLTNVCGFTPILYGDSVLNPMLPFVAAGTRTCMLMAKGAVCVAIAKEFDVKVQPRTDYIDTDQVIITMTMGAVRTEAKLIQKLNTTDY